MIALNQIARQPGSTDPRGGIRVDTEEGTPPFTQRRRLEIENE
jgi:hypothetical protein